MGVDAQIKLHKALTSTQHQAMARVIYEGYDGEWPPSCRLYVLA